ncbi:MULTISPECIES: pilus assembly protein TadG-related protein [Rhodococcus]|uniref:pilus assembly protein TadG-related protein n=1 Tax=Rhodococcus TaxID=1827 RepID=UPI000717E619|nr:MULTISPECIES: pilus assembly protein TadG-related protein [Rhodococcus]MCZ4618092.1 pilus assembly protein TadG-related protein [Rhodococcus qingshengii]MEA1798437.1 pilus assembly protein TadG-related protein [Rhodococcus qingshengii]
MKLSQWIARARSNDRGDVTIELCLAIVVLLVLLGWMYAYGINRQAHQKVEHAAGEAARAASLSRTATQANPLAYQAAMDSMDGQGLKCTTMNVSADTSGFRTRPGVSATVEVTVSCEVSYDALGWPGVSGGRTIEVTAISPIDTFRERTR